MQSKLNITEFREKLQSSIKNGHPQLKIITPFNLFFFDSSKSFYGRYDDTTFYLTLNYRIAHSSYLIKGNYKFVNNKLQIQYEIFPKFKYQKYFLLLWLACGIGMIAYINLKFGDKNDVMIPNLFLLIMLICGSLHYKFSKRIIEKKFRKIFEIYT
ncbi:hypothetical protein [Flavobacterium magnesitis]|uniref:hypothetical protein n=1 Tax=Flavobacterium magnesitis TaxID=3138077 RepID=UPI00358F40E7